MYLCICKSVSDRQIREAVELGARTVGDLTIRLGVGLECGKCLDSVRECLESGLAVRQPAPAETPPACAATPPPPTAPARPEPAPARAWFAVDL